MDREPLSEVIATERLKLRVRNEASKRVTEKVGMQSEGVLRENRVERGEAVGQVWFGILRSEWSK